MEVLALMLLALALVDCQPAELRQDEPVGWMDRIRAYMEADLAGCSGEQRSAQDLSLGALLKPNEQCKLRCAEDRLTFREGDYKYSGSSLLCCCSRQAA